jgi:hypothetical protein
MKRPILIFIACIFVLSPICSVALAQDGSGEPIKYISSCEIDLNADSLPDIALLIETIKGRELIALLRTGNGYISYLLKNDIPQQMFLSSHFGDEIKETMAGVGKNKKPKTYKTPGAFLVLYYPEEPAYGYYWNGSKFQEVWMTD